MKVFVTIVCLLLCHVGFAQNTTESSKSEKSLQFSIFPTLIFYNSCSLAYGIKKGQKENVFEAHSQFVFPAFARMFSIGISYNRNYYLKTSNTYIPIWAGLGRINVNNNYEDGGPNHDKFNFSLGTGIGTYMPLWKKHKLRFEFGLGAVFRSENQSSYQNETALPMYLGLHKFTIAETNPVLPTIRLKFRYVIPLN